MSARPTFTYLLHRGGGFTAELTDHPGPANTPAFMLGTPLVAITMRDDETGHETAMSPEYVRGLREAAA